jgi:SAM-dependent methyltransferase
MRRFSWAETKQYWENHKSRRGDIQWDRDPWGLNNICYSGAPLWLNEYYAKTQARVFESLFRLIPKNAAAAKLRSLDVGCGTGRWCQLLVNKGYEAHGIDLQSELIEANRKRISGGNFTCTSLQDYQPQFSFDLISSVTVIQHNPFEEQEKLMKKLRGLVKKGGYLILLENVRDQDPHVFSHSVQEWVDKFKDSGFLCQKIQRYDYNPCLRTYHFFLRTLKSLMHRNSSSDHVPSERNDGTGELVPLGKFLGSLNVSIKRSLIFFDGFFEAVSVKLNLPLPTIHCGFLFRAE